jgi:hypothetical protein
MLTLLFFKQSLQWMLRKTKAWRNIHLQTATNEKPWPMALNRKDPDVDVRT